MSNEEQSPSPGQLDDNSARRPLNYQPRFHVVLHQPEIPPNTGAVGRTCVAVAAKLWLIRPLGFRIDEKTRRRAGLDYWEFLEWQVVNDWNSLCTELPVDRAWYFTKSASRELWDVTFRPGDILVFGRETSGLPASLLNQHAARTVRIPTRDQVRSLNLSNSVAIALYEAMRQCRNRNGDNEQSNDQSAIW